MPRFEPFRALRYAGDDLQAQVAPPYDVLSESEVSALQASSEHNISHLDDPRVGSDRYVEAGARLAQWRRDGVLVQDAEPTLTLYRLSFTDAAGEARQISGILGGLEVVDAGAGGVLPHERTTPKASTDRLRLTRATEANLSPIWGLSLARGLTELLQKPGELVGLVVDEGPSIEQRGENRVENRVEHRVERITDPARIAAIQDALAGDDVLIADGHHRYQISRTYRDEIRDAGAPSGPAEQTLAFVNELVADQLSVQAIHRLYRSVGFETLRDALDRRFERSPIDPPDPSTLAAMVEQGFLVLIGPDGAERLSPRPGAFEELRALDGLWLEDALAGVPVEVDYQHGLAETVAAVREGDAVAGVLIRPVGVAEIERTAREGVLMPPKSTFFTPKLKTGLVIRSLVEPR